MKAKQYLKEILKYEEQLSEENREKFDIILFKIRFAHIDENDGAEFLYHCMDLFLKAQENQILPEKMLGTYDLNQLCERYIQECRGKYSFFKRIYWEIFYIPIVLLIYLGIFEMGLEMIKYAREYGFTYNVRVNTGMIINTLIVLMAVNLLLSNAKWIYMKFDNTNKIEKRKCFFAFLLLMVLFILVSLLVKQHMQVYMFQVNYFIFVGVLVIVCILQRFMENTDGKRN